MFSKSICTVAARSCFSLSLSPASFSFSGFNASPGFSSSLSGANGEGRSFFSTMT